MIERPGTKTRILDTAEKLFGINGFEAVSLRDITTAADANLAAVNYHFQSKDTLIDAVIARRIAPINERRLAMLDAAGTDASLEQVLDAFLRPVLEFDAAPLGPMLGRALSNPEMFVDRVFNVHLAPLAKRFLEALARACPALPLQEVAWRQHFAIGLMTHTLLWGPVLGRISGGLCTIEDREALIQRTIQFLGAGFRAPAPVFSK